MFKANSSRHNKILAAQKYWSHECPPVATGVIPAVVPLRKFYTEQMFVLVSMQLPDLRRHTISEAFQAVKNLCDIYTILNLKCCKCARLRNDLVIRRSCAL